MKRITLQIVFLFLMLSSFGQTHRLAILDLCERNAEINKENLASAIHMAEVAGMPYLTITDPLEAVNFPFILITSPLKGETLELDEINQLANYVQEGGVLIAPFISSNLYFDLFGINSSSLETTRYWVHWDMNSNHPELSWVASLLGGNSIKSNLFASIFGAFMYFATLIEIPIIQGLLNNGMGQGSALALLLTDSALSLPNMLVIRSAIRT